MKLQRQRMGALALTIVTAAVLVGSAQAGHPNDRAGMLGVGGVAVEQGTGAVDDQAIRPNDRPGMLGVGGIEPVRDTGVRAVTTSSADGFQWGDAAFGAAAAFGFVLLGAAGALAIRHRGRVILH